MQRKFGFSFYLSALWLAFVLTKATKQLIRHFPPPGAELNGDAYWTYLPNARKLLDHPWAFLTTDPASYYVAPLGYVWPALWGADPARIQLANCVLFLACVLLMWRAAMRLGGVFAGIISTALLVFHPDLVTYIPQVLSESVYLFGLMLLTASAVEYALSKDRSCVWLALVAVGLAITLLSRPVLQLFTLGTLFVGLVLIALGKWHTPRSASTLAGLTAILNKRVCLALAASLLLPLAVVVKNGLSFDLWGMGTGAGSGLYYGVSPFKMGLEPVFSGFKYDAGLTPLTVAPETQGHPLSLQADRINARVALDIVKNTSLADNAVFFGQKIKAWLLYSTPELRFGYKLRRFRTFEWLSIGLAALTLLASAWRKSRYSMTAFAGRPVMEREKLVLCGLLLLGVFGMALQLAPVLYNTRYNAFFLEPWLMLLAGVGTAVLFRAPLRQGSEPRIPPSRWAAWFVRKALLVLILAGLPIVLTRYAMRHETWAMDPYRPGPVAVLLDSSAQGPLQATHATPLEHNRWKLDADSATLHVPLQVLHAHSMAPEQVMDALWRLRLSVAPPAKDPPNACHRAVLSYSKGHKAMDWYEPEPVVNLRLDGAMHTYAIHGNDELRPAATGDLSITFHCPPGTIVTWAGAELLRSTLPEAARSLILHDRPIDPYLRREP